MRPVIRVRTDGTIVDATKDRVRVPAVAGAGRVRAAYMRDSQAGVIASRPASLHEHRDEVRRVWARAAGLAMDLLQNSGRLKGACDQIIADTVGIELAINPKPDLKAFGYDDKEAVDWIRQVKNLFKFWAWNPQECDFRAKFTLPQQTDIGVRNWLAYGESLGVVAYLQKHERLPGTQTGTKFLLLNPGRLVQDTNDFEGLYQGITHDAYGRPVSYRFSEKRDGIIRRVDYMARDRDGRQLVMHAFDPFSELDVRGISPLASTFRRYLTGENVIDMMAQVKFLQTVYATTITSNAPSKEVFELFEALGGSDAEGAEDLPQDWVDYFKAKLTKAAESEIKMGVGAGVSHLAPGEELKFNQLSVPGPYDALFIADLHRETARALSLSYGGYTLDYTQATYASTNMEQASLHPISRRRTDRIAAPHVLVPYAAWLDEQIGEGRISFKGGYEAFMANRDAVLWAICRGPSKPTADDEKRANAATERLLNGSTSFETECAEIGEDEEEVFESRVRWHNRYKDAGLPSPFERKTGSAPTAPSNAAAGAPVKAK